MQIQLGARVYNSDGLQVGAVSHVVINPDTKEVTHFVIKKGHLFAKDRVAPINSICASTEKRIILQQTAHDLQLLPEFEHSQQVMAEPERRIDRSVPIPAGLTLASAVPMAIRPEYVVQTTWNIPEGTVALQEGARVFASNGHHAGTVEAIFTALREDRVTHLLISKGLLLKARKLISTELVSQILDDEIHLTVDPHFLDNIPDYQPEMQGGVPM